MEFGMIGKSRTKKQNVRQKIQGGRNIFLKGEAVYSAENRRPQAYMSHVTFINQPREDTRSRRQRPYFGRIRNTLPLGAEISSLVHTQTVPRHLLPALRTSNSVEYHGRYQAQLLHVLSALFSSE